jgi:hypothetical protein
MGDGRPQNFLLGMRWISVFCRISDWPDILLIQKLDTGYKRRPYNRLAGYTVIPYFSCVRSTTQYKFSFLNLFSGLWIRICIRIRIGSGLNDFVDPDPDWESGSRIQIHGQENAEKSTFLVDFIYFYNGVAENLRRVLVRNPQYMYLYSSV